MSEAAAAGADAGQGDGGQGGGQDGGQGGGGTAAAIDWMAELAPEDKQVVMAKGWTKPADIVPAYRNIEKMIGGKALAVPNMAEPEKLGDWEGWKMLGVPEKPEGYEIKRPELGSGLQWDDSFEAQARAAGTMLKLTPFQMQGMVDLFAAHQNGTLTQMQGALDASKTQVQSELKAEWGKEYDQKVELARQAARHYGKIGEDELDRLDGILGSKGLMQLMADVGTMQAEAKLIGGGKVNFTTTTAEAESEKARLESDPVFMESYMKADHPNHKQAVVRMNALRARAAGEQA